MSQKRTLPRFLLHNSGGLGGLHYFVKNAHSENFLVSKCAGFLHYYANIADRQGRQQCVTGIGGGGLAGCNDYNDYRSKKMKKFKVQFTDPATGELLNPYYTQIPLPVGAVISIKYEQYNIDLELTLPFVTDERVGIFELKNITEV